MFAFRSQLGDERIPGFVLSCLMQRNLCILNNRFCDSLNLYRSALMSPSKSVPVSPSCQIIITRVVSPIESKNKDRCCALSVVKPLSVFYESRVDCFRVFSNVEFGKLLVSNVDRHSLVFLVANLMSVCHITQRYFMFEKL